MSEPPDAVVTDLVMPGMSGIELIHAIREHYPALPIIVVTGMEGGNVAIEALSAGATDFVTKPVARGDLDARVRRVLEEEPAKEILLEAERKLFDGLVGSHPLMEGVREFVRRVAAVPHASALILGESGTGKNVVARAIHRQSNAARFRLVEVNCSTLPTHLIEAELFGYEKGAFTDAGQAKKGLVEAAHDGTLFLDEIGTLSPELQAKFLTFLESRTFRRLGSTKDREVDLRVLAATNADLQAEVNAGRFRDDLFYRLNVAQVTLPPLRQIRSDIPDLTAHFLQRAAEYFRKPVPTLSHESLSGLLEYDWPGNARELRNLVERALIFSDGPVLRVEPPVPAAATAVVTNDRFVSLPRGLTLEKVERRYIEATLRDTGGRVEEAADQLGITRKVLWSRRKKHGLSGEETAS